MKYIILALIVLITTISCGLMPYTNTELPTFTSAEEVSKWIMYNIEYDTDEDIYGCLEYWASPKETLTSLRGDCDDYAILYLWICKDQLGIEGSFNVYEMPDGNSFHAAGTVDGFTCNNIEDAKLTASIAYYTAMGLVGFTIK